MSLLLDITDPLSRSQGGACSQSPPHKESKIGEIDD